MGVHQGVGVVVEVEVVVVEVVAAPVDTDGALSVVAITPQVKIVDLDLALPITQPICKCLLNSIFTKLYKTFVAP